MGLSANVPEMFQVLRMAAIPRLNFGRPVEKKPAHSWRTEQSSHSATYAFFQSEIDCTANGRIVASRTHRGRL